MWLKKKKKFQREWEKQLEFPKPFLMLQLWLEWLAPSGSWAPTVSPGSGLSKGCELTSVAAASSGLTPRSFLTVSGPWPWIPQGPCQPREGGMGWRARDTKHERTGRGQDRMTHAGTITCFIINGWSQMVLFSAVLCYHIISGPSHLSSQKSFRFKNIIHVHLKKKKTTYNKDNKEIQARCKCY